MAAINGNIRMLRWHFNVHAWRGKEARNIITAMTSAQSQSLSSSASQYKTYPICLHNFPSSHRAYSVKSEFQNVPQGQQCKKKRGGV